jgi:hypothetical protein
MSETFTYHGVELPYFWHLYNLTMMNERAVEIAIAHWWLEQIMDDDHPTIWSAGLEVGNVLGHYEYHKHAVWDLNEEPAWYQKLGGQPVVSADILDFVAMFAYPWVVSISTIEHTDNPLLAFDNLKSLVSPGGKLLVTFPTGVSKDLDDLIYEEALEQNRGGGPFFTRSCTIERTDDGWAQTIGAMATREYGPWANSVFIGEWERPA